MSRRFLTPPSIPDGTAADHAVNKAQLDARTTVVVNQGRIGDIEWWAWPTLPDDAVECNAQQVTAAAWPELHAKLIAAGSPFGTAGGNPLVIDMRGRVPVGQDTTQIEFDTLLETGGAKSVMLGLTHIPDHAHRPGGGASEGMGAGGAPASANDTPLRSSGAPDTGFRTSAGIYASGTYGSAARGAQVAVPTMPPYRVGRWIMRARSVFSSLESHDLADENYVDSAASGLDAAISELWASRAGVIEDFSLPAAQVPAGALLCYGQALTTPSSLRTKLIAAGNPYGTSGGNPLLPDLRGRGRAGLDNMGGTDAGRLDWANNLGTPGGSQYHSHATPLQNASGGGANGMTLPWNTSVFGLSGYTVNFPNHQPPGGAASGAGVTAQLYLTSGDSGMQPTMLLNAIVWTGERP